MVAVGTRRIRVNAWLPDDPYPLADVDDWPDEDPDADELSAPGRARRRPRLARACSRSRRELGEVPGDADLDDVSDDPLLASYHLAALAPIGPADRYRLLCARSPAERLDLLAEVPRRRRGDAAVPARRAASSLTATADPGRRDRA